MTATVPEVDQDIDLTIFEDLSFEPTEPCESALHEVGSAAPPATQLWRSHCIHAGLCQDCHELMVEYRKDHFGHQHTCLADLVVMVVDDTTVKHLGPIK